MLRLHEVQREFSRYVLQETNQLPARIQANGMTPTERLAIYRNNTRLGLTEVLRAVYPVINTLVGEAFFNRLAEAYLQTQPPQAGCLLEFGDRFTEVITGLATAHGLAYLPDVAQLEWFWHTAYHEADASPLELNALAKLDPADYERLGFKLHPSARLMTSAYPIAQIWASNQPDKQTDSLIDLQQGGCQLLVYRPEFAPQIVNLQPADYQCLTTLASGTLFAETIEQVLAEHADFDIQTRLPQWLHMGLLTEVFIQQH